MSVKDILGRRTFLPAIYVWYDLQVSQIQILTAKDQKIEFLFHCNMIVHLNKKKIY